MTELCIHLYHGRRTLDEDMEDWGRPGPRFRGYRWIGCTYGSTIRCCLQDDSNEHMLHIHHPSGLVYYDGWYYGDWDISAVPVVNDENTYDVFDQDLVSEPAEDADFGGIETDTDTEVALAEDWDADWEVHTPGATLSDAALERSRIKYEAQKLAIDQINQQLPPTCFGRPRRRLY